MSFTSRRTGYRGTALEDVLGIACERINDGSTRALDKLLTHKTAIEEHLRKRLGDLFRLEYGTSPRLRASSRVETLGS